MNEEDIMLGMKLLKQIKILKELLEEKQKEWECFVKKHKPLKMEEEQ